MLSEVNDLHRLRAFEPNLSASPALSRFVEKFETVVVCSKQIANGMGKTRGASSMCCSRMVSASILTLKSQRGVASIMLQSSYTISHPHLGQIIHILTKTTFA